MMHLVPDPDVVSGMGSCLNGSVYFVILDVQLSYHGIRIHIIPQSVVPRSMPLQPAANAASVLPDRSGASTLGQSQVRQRTKIEPSLVNMP